MFLTTRRITVSFIRHLGGYEVQSTVNIGDAEVPCGRPPWALYDEQGALIGRLPSRAINLKHRHVARVRFMLSVPKSLRRIPTQSRVLEPTIKSFNSLSDHCAVVYDHYTRAREVFKER